MIRKDIIIFLYMYLVVYQITEFRFYTLWVLPFLMSFELSGYQ